MKRRIRTQLSRISEARWRRQSLLPNLALGLLAGFVAIVRLGSPNRAFAGETEQRQVIWVLVYNYSQASSAGLAAAEHEAGRILGAAGVQPVWLECPAAQSTAARQDPCKKELIASDFTLRVLTAPTKNKFQDTVFGFAIQPVLASVYYEYASRRASNDDAEFEAPLILGCVIAHEIGHLLLGSNSHSSMGIMQSRWDSTQFRQLMEGNLLFTPSQSRFMRETAQARMVPATRALTARSTAEPLGLRKLAGFGP